MKNTWWSIMAVLALGLILILPVSSFADEKSLADILKEKGILTEEEYREAKKTEEAQKPSPPPAEKPAAQPVAGYKNGFFIQTPDGKYKLTFTGYLRSQLRLYENNTSQDNEFKVRQARIVMDGSYGEYWQSKVAAELTTTSDGKFLKFAYLNCSYLPDLQLRAGQFKAPFSREYLLSEAEVDTLEWAMIVDSAGLNPKYDIGIMLHGPKVLNGLLSYGVGVFNGNYANNNDTNDDKDLVARAVVAPFALTEGRALKGLEIGGSYETGRQTSDSLSTYKYQPKLPTDWAFFKEITYRGQRDRYGLDMAYKLGPFKLQAEWIYQRLEREKQARVNPDTNQIVSSGGKLIDAPDLICWGWYVLGTYFVWGDANRGIQLVARYEQMDVDDDPVKKYQKANPMGKNTYKLDANKNVIADTRYGNNLNLRGNTADVLTLGINYFPISNVKLAFNWYYQTLDNKYTTDKIIHKHDGSEVYTAEGGAMNAFYLLAQVKW